MSNSDKINVLLKLLEENRKQTEWVKNLDYKVVYYSVLFLLVVIGSVLAKPVQLPMWFFYLLTGVIVMLAIAFLGRNHARHADLNREYAVLAEALELTKAGTYTEKAIYTKKEGHDWPFHLGRGLYGLMIILSVILTLVLLHNLPQDRGLHSDEQQPPNQQIHPMQKPRG